MTGANHSMENMFEIYGRQKLFFISRHNGSQPFLFDIAAPKIWR